MKKYFKKIINSLEIMAKLLWLRGRLNYEIKRIFISIAASIHILYIRHIDRIRSLQNALL